MMQWETSDALPGLLVRTRQFTRSAQWWCVTISNGLAGDDAREWEFLERAETRREAITKAAEDLRQGIR